MRQTSSTDKMVRDRYRSIVESSEYEPNQYRISTDKFLNEYGKSVIQKVYDIINSYNFDDSDIMTDYFHTNFYLDLSIGKWDKPCIIGE